MFPHAGKYFIEVTRWRIIPTEMFNQPFSLPLLFINVFNLPLSPSSALPVRPIRVRSPRKWCNFTPWWFIRAWEVGDLSKFTMKIFKWEAKSGKFNRLMLLPLLPPREIVFILTILKKKEKENSLVPKEWKSGWERYDFWSSFHHCNLIRKYIEYLVSYSRVLYL